MPDRLVRRAALWHRLGRLLPAEIRTRIYEPALTDLILARLTAPGGHQRLPFAVQALGTILGCIPIAVPRLFVRHGTLTRLSWVLLAGLGLLAVVAITVQRRAMYAGIY